MKNARPQNGSGADALGKQQANDTAKDTSTQAQLVRVMQALRDGPKTTVELREMGIYQPPARVKDLRDKGHEILTARTNADDAHGYSHARIARYALTKEARHER